MTDVRANSSCVCVLSREGEVRGTIIIFSQPRHIETHVISYVSHRDPACRAQVFQQDFMTSTFHKVTRRTHTHLSITPSMSSCPRPIPTPSHLDVRVSAPYTTPFCPRQSRLLPTLQIHFRAPLLGSSASTKRSPPVPRTTHHAPNHTVHSVNTPQRQD